jgi:5-methyltetrahydropteroyltriglutamate--homocysteine methyltransferase
MLSTDTGSLPFVGDKKRFNEGAELAEQNLFSPRVENEALKYFEETVYQGFLKKLECGVDVPCFPQYRSMLDQFINLYEKISSFDITQSKTVPFLLDPSLPIIVELGALVKYSEIISEKIGRSIDMKVCITGYITAGKLKDAAYYGFLMNLIDRSILKTKHLRTRIITIDEPVYDGVKIGLEDYENILHVAKSRNVETSLHTHCESKKGILEIKNLDIIEIHADSIDKETFDITKKDLEAYDKRLQIGIGKTSPVNVVETVDTMKRRGRKAVSIFGVENIPYFSLECGLAAWNYEEALMNLCNMSRATREVNEELKMVVS